MRFLVWLLRLFLHALGRTWRVDWHGLERLEAARRAIVPGSTAADAETVANSIMATVGAKGVNVVVTPPVILIDTPEVNVNVTVNCDANGFIAPIFFAGKQLVGNATLRREQL